MRRPLKLNRHERHLWAESPIQPVFSHLADELWHTTSLDNYRAMRQDQAVRPNDGSFEFNFGQTIGSFGFKNGYISLFDFESVHQDNIIAMQDKWVMFFFKHAPATVALQFSRQALQANLVPNFPTPKNRGQLDCGTFIPFVEAWHNGSIPLEHVIGRLLIAQRGIFDNFEFEFFGPTDGEEFEATVDQLHPLWKRLIVQSKEAS